MDRPIWSSHLSRVYSEGSSVRPSARQTSPTQSLQKTGDHSISTSRSASHSSSRMDILPVVTNLQIVQPDSVLTVEDALMQSQSMQDGTSGLSDASQQMLIEVLPPVLIIHLNRFRYDAAASSMTKIGKSIRFESDLHECFWVSNSPHRQLSLASKSFINSSLQVGKISTMSCSHRLHSRVTLLCRKKGAQASSTVDVRREQEGYSSLYLR